MTSQSKSFWLVVFVCSICCELGHSQAHAQETSQPNYAVADITFNAHDGVEMFGRLVSPKSGPPRAIVIYVQTAEGATIDMKRPLGGGKTFKYYDLYREKLTKMGLGFFSYEGRGIRMGDEPPRYERIDWDVFNTSTLDNKVRDLLSAVETVRKQEGLHDVPIMLMGASEGTLLCAEAAARQPEAVSGLVLYGSLVQNLRETFRYIMTEGDFLKYRPLDENGDDVITKAEWDKAIKNVDFSKADVNTDGRFTVADLETLAKKYLDAIDNDDYEVLQAWSKAAAAVAVPEGWFKDHFSHADNWTFLSQLDMPVGCFHGDADRMAPVAAVKELERKAKKARLTKMEFHYFKGLDHSLNIGRFFVNGKMPEGHRAIFEFIDRIAPAKQYEIVEKESTVTARYNGQTLWIYNHDPVEGKPYFHPLSSTDGTMFTDLRPKDHPWHRSVWFSWKSINGVNYWEEDRQGKSEGETRLVRVTRRVSRAKTLQIDLDIDYVPAASNAVVMKEQRRVIVAPPDETGCYTVDWSSRFQALDEEVILDRTPPANEPDGKPWGGYAGWSVRMNQEVKGGAFSNSHGVEGADRQPAAWMLFNAPRGGSLLFMDHPTNLSYPTKWYLAPDMPYFSPAVIHDAPHRIRSGQTLSLRYRLTVAPGVLETDRAHKLWNQWADTAGKWPTE